MKFVGELQRPSPKVIIHQVLEEAEDSERRDYSRRDAWDEAETVLDQLEEAGFVIIHRGY